MLFSCSVCAWAVAVAILSTDAAGNIKSQSTCREPTIFQNINITRVAGHWYEYSRHDHDFEQGCDCYTTLVTFVNVNSLRVSSCCQMTTVSNETQTCNIGFDNARIADPEKNEALFLFTRNGVESQIWIVDTDYENYVIINACEHVSDDEERELFWIMTRNREITEIEAKQINDVLNANHFEKNKIIKQRHGEDVCKSKRPQREHGHGSQGQSFKQDHSNQIHGGHDHDGNNVTRSRQ